LTQNACTLYGLIHARYIITAHGLDAMYNKYAAKEFGTCPIGAGSGQPVLPVGLKDEIGVDTVKIFCPKCQCVYHPPPVRSRNNHHSSSGVTGNTGVDGASFGTTFPHLFLMTFSNLVPDPLPQDSAYIPRVFGFRVHQSARQRNSGSQGPQQQPGNERNGDSRSRARRQHDEIDVDGKQKRKSDQTARRGVVGDGQPQQTNQQQPPTNQQEDNTSTAIENTAKRRKRSDNP